MIGTLIAIIVIASWFALGAFYAPRAAGKAYDRSTYYTEAYKIGAAKASFWLTLLGGPIGALVYILRGGFIYNAEKSLVNHSEKYKKKYMKEQENRIAELQCENDRMNEKILRGR